MLRSSMRVLSLATCLTLFGVHAAATPGSADENTVAVATAAVVTAEDVEGSGWKAFVICATCVAGGIGLLGGGPAAIVAAASMPGSTLALGGCIAACASM